MADHQRKIELQSNSDLTYLLNNIRAAAQQKIDRDFPPSATQGDDEAFRNKINDLVEQYIQETLVLALPSLAINGLDATRSNVISGSEYNKNDDSNYEPYDTRLAQKLRDLYVSVEEETTKVASLRREAPKKATNSYIEALTQDIHASDADFEARRAELARQPMPVLENITFASEEDIETIWSQSRKDLEELRNVTKVKADLERAIRAAGEVQKR